MTFLFVTQSLSATTIYAFLIFLIYLGFSAEGPGSLMVTQMTVAYLRHTRAETETIPELSQRMKNKFLFQKIQVMVKKKKAFSQYDD